MDWDIEVVCQAGRKQPKLTRRAQTVRGSIHIEHARDESRGRPTLRAKVNVATGCARPAPPPLNDVQLLASVGGMWVLTGYECLEDSPLGDTRYVAQTWVIKPGQDVELMEYHDRATRLVRELEEARQRLIVLGEPPPPPVRW